MCVCEGCSIGPIEIFDGRTFDLPLARIIILTNEWPISQYSNNHIKAKKRRVDGQKLSVLLLTPGK